MFSTVNRISQPHFTQLTATLGYFRTPVAPASRQPKNASDKQRPPNRKDKSYTCRAYFLLKNPNVLMIHKRQMRNDKFTEKGRGDELNYFLKLAREQLAKIRANRISEISEDIEQLNEEIKKLEKNTSYKSKRLKEKLVQDIQNLKGLLEQFKKSLENDKKGM
ncbi:hypothetical protein KR067_002552 [Drosophila pandora]|nr:hypothetical protein KR067_002552 [Drosophila pandora]